MGLTDRLTTPLKRAPNKVCTIGWVLSWLPDSEREALEVMLADRSTYPTRVIMESLRDELHVATNRDGVDRHRRGECTTDPV